MYGDLIAAFDVYYHAFTLANSPSKLFFYPFCVHKQTFSIQFETELKVVTYLLFKVPLCSSIIIAHTWTVPYAELPSNDENKKSVFYIAFVIRYRR